MIKKISRFLIASIFSLPAFLRADEELIECAKKCLAEVYIEGKHFVVASIRTKSGQIFTGFNLKTTATRASICAESIAIAKAIESLNCDIETIVVVARLDHAKEVQIVTPCGICRELLLDYAPHAQVITENLVKISVEELLVFPYKRKG